MWVTFSSRVVSLSSSCTNCVRSALASVNASRENQAAVHCGNSGVSFPNLRSLCLDTLHLTKYKERHRKPRVPGLRRMVRKFNLAPYVVDEASSRAVRTCAHALVMPQQRKKIEALSVVLTAVSWSNGHLLMSMTMCHGRPMCSGVLHSHP